MEQKITETKQDWAWHFIYQYLDFLDKFADTHTDEVYKRMLRELQQYVVGKIDIDGEVIDFYVTVFPQARRLNPAICLTKISD